MTENERNYYETICRAIPLLSDFELGRLVGIAEEMERQNVSKSRAEPISRTVGRSPCPEDNPAAEQDAFCKSDTPHEEIC